MSPGELAEALKSRNEDEVVAHWKALGEMVKAIGVEALAVDLGVEGAVRDRQIEVWEILAPHLKAGAHTWQELHDALSPEEHDHVQALVTLLLT